MSNNMQREVDVFSALIVSCDLCLSETAATLLSMFWETASAWHLSTNCPKRNWKKWRTQIGTGQGDILDGLSVCAVSFSRSTFVENVGFSSISQTSNST